MIKICEYCGKEYIWEENQPNWGKDHPKNGKGTISSKNYCCYHCGKQDRNNKMKETNIKVYGTTCTLYNKEIRQKVKETWLNHYGVDNPAKSNEIKEKMKQTSLDKYGVNSCLQLKEIKEKSKQTFINKYGVDNYAKTPKFKNLFKNKEWVKQIKEKEYNTRKKNHTTIPELYQNKDWVDKMNQSRYKTKQKNKSFNTSKPEKEIYRLLLQKFGESNIQWQYRSKSYPFICDFYIKSLDLYIEYQGHWTHGREPYNKDNINHQKLMKIWINKSKETNIKETTKNYYKRAIYVWTDLDPKKRQIVIKNNINWLEFFNLDQFNQWYNKL